MFYKIILSNSMTEPSIIDYYNDYPQIISVIDKLNEEAIILRDENDELKEVIVEIVTKYKKELQEYKALNDLKILLNEVRARRGKKKKKNKCSCF